MAKSILDMQAEFIQGSLKIQPTMINPLKSRDEKRKVLCKFVDVLSEETFTTYIPQIMEIINMKRDVCLEYNDSEAQTDGVLKWLPRMKEYREILLETIKQHRQKYGLKL